MCALERRCRYDAKGKQLRGVGTIARETNDKIFPLVMQLDSTDRKTLAKIQKVWGETKITAEQAYAAPALVYARVNLRSPDMYIGYTENWKQRFGAHWRQTCKHSKMHPKGCKGCNEHLRYRKHRVANPEEWIMVPLSICKNKPEAKAMEKSLIQS